MIRAYLLLFILSFYSFTFQVAIGQNHQDIGFSTIVVKLRGNYPKDFSLAQFGKSDGLQGQGLLNLKKVDDSTYYSSFDNPALSQYYLILNNKYYTSQIAPNRNDTLLFNYKTIDDFHVDYRGDAKDIFMHSDQYATLMKNFFFINNDADTWTKKDIVIKHVEDLMAYVKHRTEKKKILLESMTDNPSLRSLGMEIIDVTEMTYAMGMHNKLLEGASLQERFAFYRRIFEDKAGLFTMKRPMSEIVFKNLLRDTLLQLPDISAVGPYVYGSYLKSIFGDRLGVDECEFFEHLMAIAYLEEINADRTFSETDKFNILTYFQSNVYKSNLIRLSDINAKQANSSHVHYLPFDAKNLDVFNSIISTYKGKVVLIDYWATWCGPCIASFEETKPLKEKYKDSKDVVFLYLTDESSNYNLWKDYLDKLSGEHYYITKAQLNVIFEKNKFNAIPHYMLIDRTGTIKHSETYPKDIAKTLTEWIEHSL